MQPDSTKLAATAKILRDILQPPEAFWTGDYQDFTRRTRNSTLKLIRDRPAIRDPRRTASQRKAAQPSQMPPRLTGDTSRAQSDRRLLAKRVPGHGE
jgi:hypothetical protein